MIMLSDLINKLEALYAEQGNLPILQQADGEGNSYDWSRGVELGFVDEDLEYCYSPQDFANDIEEEDREDYTKCAVIYP
ncbi:hypothetical protein ISREJYDI_CDS0137 [Pseudomonas phage UNO-G1W1]|jgi:hypothetical protein|uniref:Uncharacterized protein n=1 Tax=Pseudomonas phage UNO-G1W1 TaxID=3136609 RepID=A0AAX4MUD8_9CAUD